MKPFSRIPLFALSLSLSTANGANGTWNVDASGTWSDSANWTGGAVADVEDFTATFTRDITADRTITLDGDRTIGNLTFGDATTGTAGGWALSGPGILTLNRSTGTPTITTNALASGKTANISTVLAGNDGLNIVSAGGNGTLTLSGANTYSGTTTISTQANGAVGLIIANAQALGTSSVLLNGSNQFGSGITVNAGLTVSNNLTLKSVNLGSGRAVLGLGSGSTWSGAITIDSSTAPTAGFASIQAGGSDAATASVVSGNISYIAGTNTNALVLRSSNNYGNITGAISLGTATVQLLDTTNWQFTSTSNTWGLLDISNNGASAYVGAVNALSSTGVVTTTGSNVTGTLRLNNLAGTQSFSQTIAGLKDSGTSKVNVTSVQAATLTLNTTANQDASGIISGTITLNKTGIATQSLAGASTYTGGTSITDGTLLANNSTGSATGTGLVNVNGTNAVIGGSGTIRALNITTGIVSPGSQANGNTGILSTASITLGADSTYAVNLANPTVGTGYDQLNVTGDVTLGNGVLSLSLAGAVTGGNLFFILANDGTDAVTGTFAGLSEGGIILAGSQAFQITYQGNYNSSNPALSTFVGGNDIALLAVPEPSSLLLGVAGMGLCLRRRRVNARA